MEIRQKEVRIYLTQFGYFIGEVKEENEDTTWLQNPGQIQIIPPQNGKPVAFTITEIIPPVFKNRDMLYREFPVRKNAIMFSGPAEDSFIQYYDQYVVQLIKKRSGIQLLQPHQKNLPGNILKNLTKS